MHGMEGAAFWGFGMMFCRARGVESGFLVSVFRYRSIVDVSGTYSFFHVTVSWSVRWLARLPCRSRFDSFQRLFLVAKQSLGCLHITTVGAPAIGRSRTLYIQDNHERRQRQAFAARCRQLDGQVGDGLSLAPVTSTPRINSLRLHFER